MKYKAGDVIALWSDLEGGEFYDDLYFNSLMEDMIGFPITIHAANEYKGRYEVIDFNGDSWELNDAMIEGFADDIFRVDLDVLKGIGDINGFS